VTLESAVEREEEREGNSASGRGDRQRMDGEMSCGVSSSLRASWGMNLSGSGGTMSLELKSGHAPGKDGVGERATMVERKREGQRQLLGQRTNYSIEGLRLPTLGFTMYL
jgi:hypothetical protein